MLKIREIKPLFTSIVTTGEKYQEDMYDEHGLIECKKGDLKTYQTVVAVGSSVRDIKVGDKVMINVLHFAVRKYDPNSVKEDMGMNKVVDYRFNWVTLESKEGETQECLFIDQQDVLFVFEGEEVQGTKNPLIMPIEKKLILN